MINPIIPAAADNVGDPWEGDPITVAAWRERERRQRSVRLLMMFLLMLLLMDGEEQSARRRNGNDPTNPLRKRKNAKKNFLLDDDVFEARREQEERLIKVSRTHPRFQSLLNLNNKVNHETMIRQWADQQQEEEEGSSTDGKTKKVDPADERKIWHYPWNSTGFYRGEWIREGNDDDEDGSDEGKSGEAEPTSIQYMSAIELEGPMMKHMAEIEDKVGVYLLPRGFKVKMHNYTATSPDLTTPDDLVSALRIRSRTSASWISGVGQPELNEMFAKADEDVKPPPQVTLTKEQGRAAFQFYSRSIPAMKELSLVDGFIKLYDSNTIGYSTRRDMLLRVRGVIIHSIGRISLVSNASPGRSALVISDQSEKKSVTEQAGTKAKGTTKLSPKETETKRRRLFELVNNLGPDLHQDDLEQIRDDVLHVYPFDVLDGEDGAQWDVMQSTELGLPTFSQFDSSGWLFDILNKFWEPSIPMSSKFSRRLNELVENKTHFGAEDLSEVILTNISTPGNTSDAALFGPNTITPIEQRILKVTAPKDSNEVVGIEVDEKSKIIIPFPYVPDDKFESVRKTKTAAERRMPVREQLLEANAARCEFEINLDVKEVEWTLREWKALMARNVLDSRLRDPKLHKKEPEEGDIEDGEDGEGSHRGMHMKTKHAESLTTGRNQLAKVAIKPMQVQALVMVMSGSIHSPNCDFTSALNATAIRTDWENTTGKAINYSFYMMLTCLAQIIVLLRQLLHTQHQSTATRVSLLCIGWQTVLDALLCLGHVYLSLAMQPLFTAFASVAFFKLLIFCIIEMKYMAIIIQARNNANGGLVTTDLLRRQVAMLHLRFYVALMGAFLAFFYAGQRYRTIYMLVLYSFWVPQIVYNVITEAKRPLHTYFIYGMSISRCVVPIYMFALKDNFLKEVYPDQATNYFMVEVLVLWIGLQTAVLIAQGKYGARFMVPARFLPPKFDYHRSVPPAMIPDDSEQSLEKHENPPLGPLKEDISELCKTTGTRNRLKGGRGKPEPIPTTMTTEAITPPPSITLDCVICCNSINHHNRKGYMLAPCDHIFHKDCLIQWMDVKMECPICRTELPAV
jgi:transmembrane E3 ubiquitin-protein ligase